MKKPLLVTLADKKYLEYAKQVFAGAYFNAGWKGDYMLLAHECTFKDTEWFRNKGILVKSCRPLYKENIAGTPAVIMSKLYLFTPEFKKWSIIVYIDVDVIIRGSLDNLLNVKTFAAVPNVGGARLEDELIDKEQVRSILTNLVFLKSVKDFKKLYDSRISAYCSSVREFKEYYDIQKKAFGGGFFVLNPKLIKKTTFKEIKKIIDDYREIAANADQFALNIYFYERWQELSAIYDFYISDNYNQWGLSNKKIRTIVIHFLGTKPWMTKNYFYKEWSENLLKAEEINLEKVPSVKKWSLQEIEETEKNLGKREKTFNFYFKRRLVKQYLFKYYYRLVHLYARMSPETFIILKKIKRKWQKNRS